MKNLFRAIAVAGMIALTACAGNSVVPQTGQERYVAADGAYKALLVTVQDGVRQGIIKGERAAQVKSALETAKVALDAWALIPEDPNAESTALVALQALRELLRTVAPKPQAQATSPPFGEIGTFAFNGEVT